MKIIDDNSLRLSQNIVATIGFFDGVHIGHQHLIKQVIKAANDHKLPSAVITFRNHPRTVVHPDYTPELLTTFDERIQLLSETGLDFCIVLDFTPQLAQLSAQKFIEQVLVEKLSVKALVVGYDHRFGNNRSENFEDYTRFGNNVGLKTIKATVFKFDEINVSSSLIRNTLKAGDIKKATEFLNRPYALTGNVVKGSQLGRQIGFPTANLKLTDLEKIIPASGVYAIRALVENTFYNGMLNIGVRPTISDKNETTIEANLFEFNENLYEKLIYIEFFEKLRDERKMNGLDDLKAQLLLDKMEALKILNI
ncbi:MAG: bifunctional riboflavin kinase/FAD synthetase [Bacteroidales bacterium]|nr:bifunctional riboflavin kinase/FAD synthetase [Bacteroidales bacterium]